MAAAETPAEYSTVLNSLLDAVEPFLNEVIDHLAAAARWRDQNRGAEPDSPPRLLRDAASRISTGLAMAATADLRILRAHYDPPPDLAALERELKARSSGNTPPQPLFPHPQNGPTGTRR
ncbi:hypothetical protein [Streptomyces sp. NPDC001508]|uniref:hypothetical protein n=1 Tax=Streptomyces sp. NPDC001508 TaxID=3154656 RepID=UPI00332CD523